MTQQLHNYRKSYEKGELSQESVSENPFDQFQAWFQQAKDSSEIDEVNAMTLSTCDAQGMPRGRVVLLKEYDHQGFIFYTNYGSEKGRAIDENNQVSLSFFWPALERQIIIQGSAHKISQKHSQEYFSKRPRKSQLGALVSNQSEPIGNREALEEKWKELEARYKDADVPMPDNWGGYRVTPSTFEFWQGRRSRLHDRIYYRKENERWALQRLQP